MYIKAIKVNPKLLKWAGVALLVLLAVLLTMSFAGSRFSGAPVFSGGVDYRGIKTNEDRVDFIRQFGWEVEEAAVEVTEVTLPEQFDEVASTALNDGAIIVNPAEANHEEIVGILREVWA